VSAVLKDTIRRSAHLDPVFLIGELSRQGETQQFSGKGELQVLKREGDGHVSGGGSLLKKSLVPSHTQKDDQGGRDEAKKSLIFPMTGSGKARSHRPEPPSPLAERKGREKTSLLRRAGWGAVPTLKKGKWFEKGEPSVCSMFASSPKKGANPPVKGKKLDSWRYRKLRLVPKAFRSARPTRSHRRKKKRQPSEQGVKKGTM